MENITYDKPFKTYDQLIDLIESRNIIVNDREQAKQALSQFSYYTLINGYKSSFLAHSNQDSFKSGMTFEQLYSLHIIASSFNHIIFKYILYIENSLKTKISYLVADKYGVFTDITDSKNSSPDDYLYYKNYSNSTNQRFDILKSLKNSLHSDRNNESLSHYLNSKNHVPPWILITNISLGLTLKWFSILKGEDKAAITLQFISTNDLSEAEIKEYLIKSLQLLREYRNKIAHGHKTINEHVSTILPKKQLLCICKGFISEDEYLNNLGQNDVFAVVMASFSLLNSRELLQQFINDLSDLLDRYSTVKILDKDILSLIGLPIDFWNRLESYFAFKN